MALSTPFFLVLTFVLALADNLCQTEQGTLSDTCSDEGASFLQRAGHAAHSSREIATASDGFADKFKDKYKNSKARRVKSKVSAVDPMPCDMFTEPLQIMQSPTGFAVKELDIATGEYSDVFIVTYDSIPGGYQDINACGINPKDDTLYCVMFISKKGPYIVRIDEDSVEFVARLPWGGYIAASFSPAGNFYVSTLNSGYIVLKDLDTMPSFADPKDAADFKKKPRTKPSGFFYSADCVAMEKDLEGNGEEEYLFVLYGPKLQIAKYDFDKEEWAKTWVINVKPPRWDNIYGAGWNFQNNLFFAANRGSGVYRIPMRNFTLTTKFHRNYKMRLPKIGDSAKVGTNDGFNCMNVASPWVIPFDCKAFPGPMQAFWRKDHYELRQLDTSTGNYSQVWVINRTFTDPPFKILNAWSINPVDRVVYASLVMDSWDPDIYPTPPPFYVVRIDDTKIRFVAKVQAPFGKPIAGAFGPKGTYYVVSNPSLIEIKDIAAMKEYDTHDNPAMPVLGEDAAVIMRNMTGVAQLADIVAVEADLGDGRGEKTWVVGANTAAQIVLMDPAQAEYHIIKTTDIYAGTYLEGNWQRQNLGAAWNFEGNVYFASNDGLGVYKVPMDDIKYPFSGLGKLTLPNVGMSDPIWENDGLNCVKKPDPWK